MRLEIATNFHDQWVILRELAAKLNRSMAHVPAQCVAMLTATGPEAMKTGDKA
jgi:hypothetical protein